MTIRASLGMAACLLVCSLAAMRGVSCFRFGTARPSLLQASRHVDDPYWGMQVARRVRCHPAAGPPM